MNAHQATSTEQRSDYIKKIFKTLESCKLKPNDENFINSISDFFLSRGYLSDKQYEALLNIYERA